MGKVRFSHFLLCVRKSVQLVVVISVLKNLLTKKITESSIVLSKSQIP